MNSRSTRAATGASQEGLVRPTDDLFTTHPNSVRALLSVERFAGTVLEPAAGDGTMAEVLRRGVGVTRVIESDLHSRGRDEVEQRDFLSMTDLPFDVDHIVTNPPFNLAGQFVEKALDLEPRKIAMFLRLAFLEGKRRGSGLFRTRPPSRVWVFSSRQPLRRDGGPWQAGLIAFSWFVWDRTHVGPTRLGWLP